jgi:hypothetical protein
MERNRWALLQYLVVQSDSRWVNASGWNERNRIYFGSGSSSPRVVRHQGVLKGHGVPGVHHGRRRLELARTGLRQQAMMRVVVVMIARVKA